MARAFRIVQLSDLHLSDSDSDHRIEPKIRGHLTGMNERFRALVTTPLVQDADLVLVTGDVTDTGNIKGWQHFWQAIEERGLLTKTHVLVGNHDVAFLGLWRWITPRVTRSIARWRYMRGLKIGKSPRAYPWHIVVNEGTILVTALRSTMESNSSSFFNALGRVPESQLSKLKRILVDNASIKHKIVTLHHPPIFPADGSVPKLLHDIPKAEGDRLIDLCAKHGVRLVLHGHMHTFMDQMVGETRIVGAPASTQPVVGSSTVDICVYDFKDEGFTLTRHRV